MICNRLGARAIKYGTGIFAEIRSHINISLEEEQHTNGEAPTQQC
jgi:hypothetical protein